MLRLAVRRWPQRTRAVNTFWIDDAAAARGRQHRRRWLRRICARMSSDGRLTMRMWRSLARAGAAAVVCAAMERWAGASVARCRVGRPTAVMYWPSGSRTFRVAPTARCCPSRALTSSSTQRRWVWASATRCRWLSTAIPDEAVVLDLVYRRRENAVCARRARMRGLRAADGLVMLLEQGALAFERWFGVGPDREMMRRALAGRAVGGTAAGLTRPSLVLRAARAPALRPLLSALSAQCATGRSGARQDAVCGACWLTRLQQLLGAPLCTLRTSGRSASSCRVVSYCCTRESCARALRVLDVRWERSGRRARAQVSAAGACLPTRWLERMARLRCRARRRSERSGLVAGAARQRSASVSAATTRVSCSREEISRRLALPGLAWRAASARVIRHRKRALTAEQRLRNVARRIRGRGRIPGALSWRAPDPRGRCDHDRRDHERVRGGTVCRWRPLRCIRDIRPRACPGRPRPP